MGGIAPNGEGVADTPCGLPKLPPLLFYHPPHVRRNPNFRLSARRAFEFPQGAAGMEGAAPVGGGIGFPGARGGIEKNGKTPEQMRRPGAGPRRLLVSLPLAAVALPLGGTPPRHGTGRRPFPGI